MRFLWLDLIRYGGFTDKRLAFRAGAGLHLIYGPNEAGKSSTLHAIGDLLFGFPQRIGFDFLHAAKDLRVGAALESRDGRTLAFRRRRGNKQTLLDPDEAPLPDDSLLPFLGRLDRPTFSRAFGLDSNRLVEGGEAMLDSEGELGAALFAAASGLSGLNALRRSLDADADRLFAPRASKDRAFYQALERYSAARQRERETELRHSDWKALTDAIATIEARLAELRAERLANGTEIARLQHLTRLAPLLDALDAEQRALEGFSDLPPAPIGFCDTLSHLLATADAAARQHDLIGKALDEAETEARRLSPDSAALAHSAEILALFARKGEYQSKLRDIPAIARERDGFVQDLAKAARRLGLDGLEALETMQPSDAELASLSEAIELGRTLHLRRAQLDTRLSEEQAALLALEREHEDTEPLDPKPWRERFAALEPEIMLLAREAELSGRHRVAKQKLDDALGRLRPALSNAELVAAPLPWPDALAVHGQKLGALARERSGIESRCQDLAGSIEEAERRLAEARRRGLGTSPEAIAAARRRRDGLFAPLARHVEDIAALAREAWPAALEAFVQAVAQADQMADLALAEADLQARHAETKAMLADLERALEKAETERQAVIARQAEADTAYAALFDPAGIVPHPPGEMVLWLRSVQALREDAEQVRSLEQDLSALEQAAEGIRPALEAIADGIGLVGHGLSLQVLARSIRLKLADLGETWSARQGQVQQRRAVAARIERIEADRIALAADEDAARRRFVRSATALGLSDEAGLAEAEAALSVWREIPKLREDQLNRARRVAGMERDIAQFAADAESLAGLVAPALASLPSDLLVDALEQRAREAGTVRSLLAQAQTRAKDLGAQLRAAEGASRLAQRPLAEALAPFGDAASPSFLIERLAARDAQIARADAAYLVLAREADGLGVEGAREALRAFEHTAISIEIEDLQRRSGELTKENEDLYAELGALRHRRTEYEQGSGSELAAFERNSAASDMLASARQWAVIRIASTMLSAAMERHRQQQSDPMMQRAGALFASLTNDAFAGLIEDYGDDDRVQLAGLRPGGQRVAIAGMSEGTRDQVYLALRLAYLVDFSSRSEPVPLIGDDIFQTFDDARTAAGLRALASTGASFQSILFTHHRSVVDIAIQELGEGLDLISL